MSTPATPVPSTNPIINDIEIALPMLEEALALAGLPTEAAIVDLINKAFPHVLSAWVKAQQTPVTAESIAALLQDVPLDAPTS